MSKKKTNKAGPPMTREQLGSADPRLAAAFIAFAERLGRKTKAMTENAESLDDRKSIQSEMKADADAFLKKHR